MNWKDCKAGWKVLLEDACIFAGIAGLVWAGLWISKTCLDIVLNWMGV